MYAIFVIVQILVILVQFQCFPPEAEQTQQDPITANLSSPLIITPYLKDGKVKEAQEASTVKFAGFKGVKSYAAYFTVDPTYNSNLFFWFFPAQTNYATAPVVLWLQGGPGASSLYGLFLENGPFSVKNKHGLKLRQYSWNENHSVIYIDSPVGTGLSFTNDGGYAQNQTIIGDHLYNAVLQFFQLFPELQKNNFFVTGESYAGKYAPALAYTIHKNNPNAQQKINLQGLAIGNGFCDPERQIDYSDYLYQIGVVDINEREKFRQLKDEILKYIQNKQWVEASETLDKLISSNNPTLFKNVTHSDNPYNFLDSNSYDEMTDALEKYIQRDDVREYIHVGNTTFHCFNPTIKLNLKADRLQSVVSWISELLEHYRILFFNGQLDIVVAYPLTLNFLQNLNFAAANEYKTAPRKTWYVDSQLAGYVKQAGNLYEVLVKNAGHMVPMDQPRWALDLITRFTHNKSYNTD